MAVLQVRKEQPSDEGRQRQMAMLAFSAFSELKHVFLVDEDVDPFDMNDVLWAMNTRFQGDADIITIPGVRTHPLDPSNDPTMSPSIRDLRLHGTLRSKGPFPTRAVHEARPTQMGPRLRRLGHEHEADRRRHKWRERKPARAPLS